MHPVLCTAPRCPGEGRPPSGLAAPRSPHSHPGAALALLQVAAQSEAPRPPGERSVPVTKLQGLVTSSRFAVDWVQP